MQDGVVARGTKAKKGEAAGFSGCRFARLWCACVYPVHEPHTHIITTDLRDRSVVIQDKTFHDDHGRSLVPVTRQHPEGFEPGGNLPPPFAKSSTCAGNKHLRPSIPLSSHPTLPTQYPAISFCLPVAVSRYGELVLFQPALPHLPSPPNHPNLAQNSSYWFSPPASFPPEHTTLLSQKVWYR